MWTSHYKKRSQNYTYVTHLEMTEKERQDLKDVPIVKTIYF